MTPIRLARDGNDFIQIEWSDGSQQRYAIRALRDACPCATCREKRTGAAAKPATLFPILPIEEIRPLRLLGMKPVGNYAYSLSFSDGHDTGIYTFEFLRELGSNERKG